MYPFFIANGWANKLRTVGTGRHVSTLTNAVFVSGGSPLPSWRRLRNLLAIVLLLTPIYAFATAYTVTSSHRTMHKGDFAPPCDVQVTAGGVQVGAGSAIFSTAPTCSVGATNGSAIGTYTITVTPGTLTNATDSATYTNGSIDVIAVDGIGAQITGHGINYPPGFFSATAYPVINMVSNSIASLVGGCSVGTTLDNGEKIQELLAWGRGTASATVTTSGTAVTETAGTVFTGLSAGSHVTINGIVYNISSVTSGTSLVLTTSAGTQSGVRLAMPPTVVTTNGTTTVTATSGPTFEWLPSSKGQILIKGVKYNIASITDATHLVTTTAVPAFTNVNSYEAPLASGAYGAEPQYFYLPPGCYTTSEPMYVYGNYWSFWGGGPQSSYFYLKPNSPIFNTGTNAEFFSPQSIGGNQNFNEFVYNIGFRIGVGNPNAAPYTTESNNVGAARNVQIWSDDALCPWAIDLSRAYPGPTLFHDVAVYGCANATHSIQGEYLVTLENITAEGQTSTVFDNPYQKISLRHILSDNEGTVLHMYGGSNESTGALLDSEFLNGNSSNPAVQVDVNNSLYIKNLTVTGYTTSDADSGTGTLVNTLGNITQVWTGPAQTIFNGSQTPDSLHLPENETPLPSNPAVSGWMQLSATITDWPTQFGSPTSTAVYAAPGSYSGTGTISFTIPSTVNYVNFYHAMRGNAQTWQLSITISDSSTTPLIIEGCPYVTCTINHTGARPIVMKDATINEYTSAAGSGDVYIEDAGFGYPSETTPTFYSSQHVWARQLNLEQATAPSKFSCNGATMWILGYKTEQNPYNILETNGCQVEVFGGFFYSNVPLPVGQVTKISLNNSKLFLGGIVSEVDQPGYGDVDWVQETQNGVTNMLPTGNMNNSIRLPMFYSFGPVP